MKRIVRFIKCINNKIIIVIYGNLFNFTEMKYKLREYAELKKVTYRTVWTWVKKGLVKTESTPSGRLLIIED